MKKFRTIRLGVDLIDSTSGTILKYDKLEHFILSYFGLLINFILTFFILNKSVTFSLFIKVIIFWEVIGLLYEIKDGFYSHGFSWVDFFANNLGFMLAIITFGIILWAGGY